MAIPGVDSAKATTQGINVSNQMWKPERWGRTWYVSRVHRGVLEYLRSVPCNYGPRGRIISFRSEASAQRRSDSLNAG